MKNKLTIQRLPSLPMNNQTTIEDLSILFRRGSFVSAEDFRVSLAEVGEVVESRMITPKPLKSRTTSYGRPDHMFFKHQHPNDFGDIEKAS